MCRGVESRRASFSEELRDPHTKGLMYAFPARKARERDSAEGTKQDSQSWVQKEETHKRRERERRGQCEGPRCPAKTRHLPYLRHMCWAPPFVVYISSACLHKNKDKPLPFTSKCTPLEPLDNKACTLEDLDVTRRFLFINT